MRLGECSFQVPTLLLRLKNHKPILTQPRNDTLQWSGRWSEENTTWSRRKGDQDLQIRSTCARKGRKRCCWSERSRGERGGTDRLTYSKCITLFANLKRWRVESSMRESEIDRHLCIAFFIMAARCALLGETFKTGED